jgi:hypothetical protein
VTEENMKKKNKVVGFEVLTAVVMKSSVFWDVTLSSPLKVSQHLGGTYRFHLQGQGRNQH